MLPDATVPSGYRRQADYAQTEVQFPSWLAARDPLKAACYPLAPDSTPGRSIASYYSRRDAVGLRAQET